MGFSEVDHRKVSKNAIRINVHVCARASSLTVVWYPEDEARVTHNGRPYALALQRQGDLEAQRSYCNKYTRYFTGLFVLPWL